MSIDKLIEELRSIAATWENGWESEYDISAICENAADQLERLNDFEQSRCFVLLERIAKLEAERDELKERVKAKEIINSLIETTMSMLSSDKDTLIHKFNSANKEIAKLKASQPVRCGECVYKNNDEESCYCEHGLGGWNLRADDFCSYGERRGAE